MAGPDYYAVDYFQLNASLNRKGDAAIALLVLRSPSSKDTKAQKGTIKSCVLVDGGNGALVSKLICRALDNIQKNYVGDALLDAISLSHWDAVSLSLLMKKVVANPLKLSGSRKVSDV